MHIRGDTFVRQPPVTVFDFVADERNNYDPTVIEAELLTGTPIGVGTGFRCVAGSRRRPVEMTVEIVEYDRPHRLVTITRLDRMAITSRLTFGPDGGGTRLGWDSELQARGWLRPFAPALALFGRRRTRAIWTGLKHTLENRRDDAAPAST